MERKAAVHERRRTLAAVAVTLAACWLLPEAATAAAVAGTGTSGNGCFGIFFEGCIEADSGSCIGLVLRETGHVTVQQYDACVEPCPGGFSVSVGETNGPCVAPGPVPGVPTGVRDCGIYNSIYTPVPYPGQDTGIVIEFNPPGPAGDLAFCAGAVTGAPCSAGQPGVLVNNMPVCVPNLCPQGVNPTTVAACGVGPLCPGGITSPPGPGQIAVVCSQALSACSLSGGGLGPGWTAGANGLCIGMPWVAQGAASPCPAGADVNFRIFWGTTPGFPPGSTLDVCLNPIPP